MHILLKTRRLKTHVLKYIGDNNSLIYGKTYFIQPISNTHYLVFNSSVENGVSIDLVMDNIEKFIEPKQFRTHVIGLLLSQTY